MDDANAVSLPNYTLVSQHKREDVRAGGVAILQRTEALTRAIIHELTRAIKLEPLGLDDQCYRTRAACSKRDMCAAEVAISGITTLLVSADISPGTGPDDLQFLLLRFLMAYTAKAANAVKIIKEQNYTRCPSCSPAGDVNLDTRPARITTGSPNS
jgi:hypothetical protein